MLYHLHTRRILVSVPTDAMVAVGTCLTEGFAEDVDESDTEIEERVADGLGWFGAGVCSDRIYAVIP